MNEMITKVMIAILVILFGGYTNALCQTVSDSLEAESNEDNISRYSSFSLSPSVNIPFGASADYFRTSGGVCLGSA